MKISQLVQQNNYFLIFYLVSAITLRFFSFFPSVIDHDESTYMVIARDIFEGGKVLYKDVIDTKPPGIFLLFGLIQKITGTSIAFFRLFTAIFVGFTAFFIFLLAIKWHGKRNSAIASGFIYIFFISTWQHFGMSSNAELFFSFFNVLGIFLLLKKKGIWLFLAGFSFGFGFIIKYSNLFDVLPVVFYFIVFLDFRKDKILSILLQLIIIGTGFLMPFLSANLYFYFSGYFDSFRFILYDVPLNYSTATDWSGVLDRLIDFHAFFLPAIFYFYFILFRKNREIRSYKIFIMVWLVFVFYSILSLGNTFPHYFIQLMLPMSLLGGFYFDTSINYPQRLKPVFRPKVGYVLLVLFIVFKLYADYKDYYLKKDYAREISDYINENTSKGDIIYTGNYHHIIYFLTGKESPSPYVHWTLIYYERLKRVMQVDNREEVEKIFTQKPEYVVIDGQLKEDIYINLREQLLANYNVEKSLDERIFLYRRKNE